MHKTSQRLFSRLVVLALILTLASCSFIARPPHKVVMKALEFDLKLTQKTVEELLETNNNEFPIVDTAKVLKKKAYKGNCRTI